MIEPSFIAPLQERARLISVLLSNLPPVMAHHEVAALLRDVTSWMSLDQLRECARALRGNEPESG